MAQNRSKTPLYALNAPHNVAFRASLCDVVVQPTKILATVHYGVVLARCFHDISGSNAATPQEMDFIWFSHQSGFDPWILEFRQSSFHLVSQSWRELLGLPASPHSALPSCSVHRWASAPAKTVGLVASEHLPTVYLIHNLFLS